MNKLFILIAVVCVVIKSPAQSELRLKAGIISSNLSEDLEDFEFSSQTGYEFGVDFLLGGKVYIQPGVSFEVVKNEVTPIDPIADIETDMTLNRIRIPALIGYRLLDPSEEINIRIYAGPEASFFIGKDFDSNLSFDEDDFNDVLWAGHIGTGVDISIFFIDLGYTFGLSDVFENVDNSPRNNLFHGNVGLRIRF